MHDHIFQYVLGPTPIEFPLHDKRSRFVTSHDDLIVIGQGTAMELWKIIDKEGER